MRCEYHNGQECSHEQGRKLYGPRPSEGICKKLCPHRVSTEPAIVQLVVKPPAPPPKTLVQKAMSWAKAEISRVVEGPLQGDALEARLSLCRVCPALDSTNATEGQLGWCTKCGCNLGSKRAELTIKATMPKATCPLNKWPKEI